MRHGYFSSKRKTERRVNRQLASLHVAPMKGTSSFFLLLQAILAVDLL